MAELLTARGADKSDQLESSGSLKRISFFRC